MQQEQELAPPEVGGGAEGQEQAGRDKRGKERCAASASAEPGPKHEERGPS